MLNSWSVGVNGDNTISLQAKETDREVSFYWQGNFQNQSYASVNLTNNYTYLFFDFDPTNLYQEGTQPLPALTGYTYNNISLEYGSSPSKNFQFGINTYTEIILMARHLL
ncbi:MAG: hypothetical protein IPL65_10250 [Lewinellaceae bacterium]|nr:hypothetical protein [Lewinellaceae bacterium]